MIEDLQKREVNGGQVEGPEGDVLCLSLPELNEERYSLAQLDDYMHLTRGQFPHQPPFRMKLEARVSNADLPGTWGFGLWNDPFSVGSLTGGVKRLLPVLPNAAWFFYGSRENHLTLQDDVPASGFHMKTFRSPLVPSIFSILAVPVSPFLLCSWTARIIRRTARALVQEDAHVIKMDVTDWHSYGLIWERERVRFTVDDTRIFQTANAPKGRMGLVIWIDNQYFSFTSKGHIKFGSLRSTTEAILEIRHLFVENDSG
jgi:hypothetical protein